MKTSSISPVLIVVAAVAFVGVGFFAPLHQAEAGRPNVNKYPVVRDHRKPPVVRDHRNPGPPTPQGGVTVTKRGGGQAVYRDHRR